jgi:hypothetical protein
MLEYSVTNLESRLAERRQHLWQLVSLLLHVGLISLLWVATSIVPLDLEPVGDLLTVVYVPPKSMKKPPPGSGGVIVEASGLTGADIDLTGNQLVIQDDPRFDLMRALSRYHGFLGCPDKKEPKYVTDLFQAPDWKPSGHGWVSIDRFFTVEVREPQLWPFAANVERPCHLASGGKVYALFPSTFHALLDKAIWQEVAQKVGRGRVSKATIAFSEESVVGFVVQNVTVNPQP